MTPAPAGHPPRARWTTTDASKWLVGPPSPAATSRLLCIPHAGGGPSTFRPWAALLSEDVELLVAHLPGRESRHRETALDNAAIIAAHVVDALERLPARPLRVFGHSMGALIAYEVAHQLQRQGKVAPVLLVVSGHGSPQAPLTYSTLPDPEAPDLVRIVSRQYGGIPSELMADPSLLDFFEPLLRADFRVVADHIAEWRPPLCCPLLVLAGQDDPHVALSACDAWRECTTGPWRSQRLVGGHFYLATQPQNVLDAIFSAAPTS